jgi:hypothetical protein
LPIAYADDYHVVLLDIPNLCVQNIHLKVDTVTAKVALDAQVSRYSRRDGSLMVARER